MKVAKRALARAALAFAFSFALLSCGPNRPTPPKGSAPGRTTSTGSPPPRHTEPVAPAPAPRCGLADREPDGATRLERTLVDALLDARFDYVVDLAAPGGAACEDDRSCPRIRGFPTVDVAVAVFAPGCAPTFANVMLSQRLPGGRINRFEPSTLALQGVRLRPWSPSKWTPDAAGPGASGDLLPGSSTDEAAVDFEVPYPASNFKLLVAVEIVALSDRGRLGLDERLTHRGRSRAVRDWLEDMITWSDDAAAEALVRRIHALGEAEGLNARFARLGLSGLSIHGTSAESGRNWQPGRIHMTAWDTVRLLWLLDPDAPRPTWTAPDGEPVDTSFLQPSTRAHLFGLLGQQAFHDVLSGAALCGRDKTSEGIPALLPARWMADDGRVLLHGGRDARPCNAAADVTFAHKTGLTLNFGSDAGIVRGIDGRAKRHYLVAFFSNLGHRFADADKVGDHACERLGICYTQRIPRFGRALDSAIAQAVGDSNAGGPAEQARTPRPASTAPGR